MSFTFICDPLNSPCSPCKLKGRRAETPVTGMRGAPQVDEGEAVREGGSHGDRNMTVAIFYNGYTDGCSTLLQCRAHLLYGIVEHASCEMHSGTATCGLVLMQYGNAGRRT